MNFEHFLVKKISNANFHKNSISSPIIKIGTTAISIGIIVMIISFAIGTGMQKEIKDKISSVEGHINIQSFNNTSNENISIPINPNNDFINKTYLILSRSTQSSYFVAAVLFAASPEKYLDNIFLRNIFS